MVARGRVTNYSLKGLFMASSCVFGLDLVILICYDLYVRWLHFLGCLRLRRQRAMESGAYQFGYPAVSGCHLSLTSLHSDQAGCLIFRDNILCRVQKPVVRDPIYLQCPLNGH
jgi:hypothetical protein